jgi:putative cell wall-binding protein
MWYQTPPVVTLPSSSAGAVVYRWDAGPGPWLPSPGLVSAPLGRHALQVAVVRSSSEPVVVSTTVVKSDSRMPTARAAGRWVGTAAGEGELSVTGRVSVLAVVGEGSGAIVARLGGQNRYDTAVLISQADFASAGTVIIATGTKFPDALAASPLAGCLRAPILLTQPSSLPAYVQREIRRLGASKAVIVGGTASVTPAVEKQLRGMGLSVERLGGKDRYVNSSLVTQRVMSIVPGQSLVMVATGEKYPDALSLSPGAYRLRSPILLVRAASVPASVKSSLSRYRFSTGVVAGGPGSVSPAVYRQVDTYVGSLSRLTGIDRYAVAAKVADKLVALGSSASYTGCASGEKFPDALTGGVGAGNRGGVILLTKAATLPAPTRRWITAHQYEITVLHVYGGPASVSPAVFNQIRDILK